MNGWLALAAVLGIVAARYMSVWSKGHRVRRSWEFALEAIKAGNMEEAESALRKCVRLAPGAAFLRRMLGRVLVAQKKYDEAEESFRFAAQLEPRVSAHLLDLGSFLAGFRPKCLNEAFDVFAKAVELDPAMRRTLAELPHLAFLHDHPRFRALIVPDTSNE